MLYDDTDRADGFAVRGSIPCGFVWGCQPGGIPLIEFIFQGKFRSVSAEKWSKI